ncbi:hypothetical protein HanPSC8_Chr01g0039421 [Helianthus annuus]|nr:hypothetical protein HanPSC8_Chr01g0039421 [Helianthus annuus]
MGFVETDPGRNGFRVGLVLKKGFFVKMLAKFTYFHQDYPFQNSAFQLNQTLHLAFQFFSNSSLIRVSCMKTKQVISSSLILTILSCFYEIVKF